MANIQIKAMQDNLKKMFTLGLNNPATVAMNREKHFKGQNEDDLKN